MNISVSEPFPATTIDVGDGHSFSESCGDKDLVCSDMGDALRD